MEPILALAAIKSVAGIISNLTTPTTPRVPHYTQAPIAKGPFAESLGQKGGFENVLSAALGKEAPQSGPLRFSPEAAKKLEMMNVRLNQTQYEKLMEGVREAAAKGSEKSLVMMDGMAFVVDVKRGEVLDVSDRNRIETKTYTRIDSVVETKI